ncbi:MAG TPA: hypothetical protein VM186_14420 [Planctomycetota bacterium]|nr:hypothetical protein [Planctomycetota bacterium]
MDIVAAHNAARPPADRIERDSRRAWVSVDEMRLSGVTGFSSCDGLDERTLLLIYDRIGYGWSPIPDDSDETKSVWVMGLRVVTQG